VNKKSVNEAGSITMAISQFAAGIRTKYTCMMSLTALETEWLHFDLHCRYRLTQGIRCTNK
jgi:hypothetical protein